MAAVATSGGLTEFLDTLLGELQPDWIVNLYKNDVTPTADTVTGDLEECDWGGYGGQAMPAFDAATWNSGAGEAEAEQPAALDYTKSGGSAGDIYGVFIVDTGGDLKFAWRDPAAPITMGTDGDIYRVNLRALLAG